MAMMLVRGKRGFDLGYSSFSLRGLPSEGLVASRTSLSSRMMARGCF